jgi:hypothetical protein
VPSIFPGVLVGTASSGGGSSMTGGVVYNAKLVLILRWEFNEIVFGNYHTALREEAAIQSISNTFCSSRHFLDKVYACLVNFIVHLYLFGACIFISILI